MATHKNETPCHSSCTPPSPESDDPRYYDWNGIMLMAAIGCIFTVFITTVIMYYIYFRLCSTRARPTQHRSRPWRTDISRGRRHSWRAVDGYYFAGSPMNEGLRSAAVEALPVFVFKAEAFKDGMRCAVCLCDFQENEKGRSLPNCGHSFHVECIDMWFYSHTTCPLCRQGVENVGEVEDSRAEDKIISVSVSGGSESQHDGVEERKEMEGEGVGIAVSARQGSHIV